VGRRGHSAETHQQQQKREQGRQQEQQRQQRLQQQQGRQRWGPRGAPPAWPLPRHDLVNPAGRGGGGPQRCLVGVALPLRFLLRALHCEERLRRRGGRGDVGCSESPDTALLIAPRIDPPTARERRTSTSRGLTPRSPRATHLYEAGVCVGGGPRPGATRRRARLACRRRCQRLLLLLLREGARAPTPAGGATGGRQACSTRGSTAGCRRQTAANIAGLETCGG